MDRVKCSVCEHVQPSSSVCRRCGRPLASAEPEAKTVVVEVVQVVEKQIVDHSGTFDEIERAIVLARIKKNGGNVSAAAQSLGLHRNTLLRKLREWRVPQNGAPAYKST